MEEAIKTLSDRSWDVLKSFFQHNDIISTQMDSYEHFVHHILPNLIRENSVIWTKCEDRMRRDKFWFDGITIKRPQIKFENGETRDVMPNEAKNFKITYSIAVRVTLHHETYIYSDVNLETDIINTIVNGPYQNIPLFEIPCMVRSSYCHWYTGDFDPANKGGYFIINGQ